jgi:hypothetical protein
VTKSSSAGFRIEHRPKLAESPRFWGADKSTSTRILFQYPIGAAAGNTCQVQGPTRMARKRSLAGSLKTQGRQGAAIIHNG